VALCTSEESLGQKLEWDVEGPTLSYCTSQFQVRMWKWHVY